MQKNYHVSSSVGLSRFPLCFLVNEKVQKQLGAADLCHGLDPTNRSYDQAKMREHYITCLESRTITPFPKTTKGVPYHMDTKKIAVPIFFDCRLPNDKKEYVSAPNVVAVTIQIV